jgi:hypothetical protein
MTPKRVARAKLGLSRRASEQPLGVRYSDLTPEQLKEYNRQASRKARLKVAAKRVERKPPAELTAQASAKLKRWFKAESLLPPGIEPY